LFVYLFFFVKFTSSNRIFGSKIILRNWTEINSIILKISLKLAKNCQKTEFEKTFAFWIFKMSLFKNLEVWKNGSLKILKFASQKTNISGKNINIFMWFYVKDSFWQTNHLKETNNVYKSKKRSLEPTASCRANFSFWVRNIFIS
jgi:hypothetical protein